MSRHISSVLAVFIDRDGVINRKMPEGQYVKSWSDFHLLPGAAEAIVRLKRAGLFVIVVTNQRGIALGRYNSVDVDRIHAQLQSELAAQNAQVDGFYICPHDRDTCNCRKPLTGLFDQAKAAFPILQPGTSVLVGDSLSDIEFGRRLGMATIFIEGDLIDGEERILDNENAAQLADFRFPSLAEAVDAVLDTGTAR
ncbi:D-glycero-alpha-D-manno-heptose-1,7-bisphosphate 7-phosphatase [Occallatibacter riparius]|uniref:D,D-heptose 1,7-bisphosphate phosphatase n=1 Tax=Occallatibacter riparius TaxID=1002689 RepID=A0A9J7BX71_9BACT|nr:HAD family hydrolase [Occallatibacter riparius]UWZ85534.1 HAD family hydrolase [Occallatibacter riparius]